MDHLKRVADEFARQAQNFDNWAAKADDPGRFGAALGDARRGKLLEVACGPGVVTAALAPGQVRLSLSMPRKRCWKRPRRVAPKPG